MRKNTIKFSQVRLLRQKQFLEKKLEDLLIQNSRAGDKEAFGKLIHFYRRRLYSYLLRSCRDKDLADDLFQEVLIKVWQGLKKYKDRQKFASWLFTVAHNVMIDSKRKKNIKNSDIFESDLASDYNLEKKLEFDESKEIIYKILEELNENQRQVFLMRQHSGQTFREISEILNQPLNTVISHMNYAVKKIKKILKEDYEITG